MISAQNQSYACGTSQVPLDYSTIGTAFDRTVERFGDRPALIVRDQNVRWSYKEFKEQVDGFAAGLLALGLTPGDRVGIWAPNCSEWAVTQYATAKAGLIQVNINPAYRVDELKYCINKVGCKALITAARFKTSDYIAMLNDLAPEIAGCEPGATQSDSLPSLETLIRLGDEPTPGFYNYADVAGFAGPDEPAKIDSLSILLQPDDPINIQFTSGTTGTPKGATLTHFNILNNAHLTGIGMGISEKDVLCCPVPLYHCAGMVIGNLTCLIMGAAIVYPGEAFDPTLVLEAVEQERCTILVGVPTMFIAELDHPDFTSFDVSSLRGGFIGGAPCPIEVMKRLVTDLHMPDVTIVYGMTETSPVSFQTALDDPLEKRVGTVGRVQPHVEVKLVDVNGRIVPCGTQGEILTRGYSIMLGYWADDGRTAEAVDPAGWMHTGDLGEMSEDGYLRITGRAKDMVIRGGENIYPVEIEEYLFTHPDIVEAQVFGIPDHKLGEEVCAWVRLKDGAHLDQEAIREFCRGEIAHFKIPRHIRFVDEFPMTVTGKIQKFAMRDVMIEDMNLTVESTA